MEKLILREDYAPKPNLQSKTESISVSKTSDKIEDRIIKIEEKLDKLCVLMERIHQSLQTNSLLQKEEDHNTKTTTKKEYISALQREMEINRQCILREFHRIHNDGSLKGHGDPLFY